MDGKNIFWYRGKRWRNCYGAGWEHSENIKLLPPEKNYEKSLKNTVPGPSIEEIENEIKHLEEEEMILKYELNEIIKRKYELQKK